jgi:hypothetical protein
MREPTVAEGPAPASASMRLALVIAAVATIWLGVVPGRVLGHASLAALDLQPKTRAAKMLVPAPGPTPAVEVATPAK